MHTIKEVSKFVEFPFSEALRQDLATAGFETPTPIQAKSIAPAIEGRDVIGLAQTGTGKTAAFALPIIHRLSHKSELGALVLAPTRELVVQIVEVFRKLGRTSGLRVIGIVGGVKMENDWKALRSWPNVIVATPGRLLDHLEQKTLSLKEIEIFVIDEADRMHDMGFIPQIRRIISALPQQRQTMMFTATMPSDVEHIVRQSMRHDAVKIQAGPASRPVERAVQKLFSCSEDDKVNILMDQLREEEGRTLIFLRTKRGVDRLARRVTARHRAVRLHGDREQAQRDEAMQGFRDGKYRILIATDIAARGLDVADIEHVINYDFPRAPEDYVHRIGRTARMVATGKATSFVTPADRKYVAALEKLIGAKLPLIPAPGVKPMSEEEAAAAASRGHDRGHDRGHGGGGRGRDGHRGGRPGAGRGGSSSRTHGGRTPTHAPSHAGHMPARAVTHLPPITHSAGYGPGPDVEAIEPVVAAQAETSPVAATPAAGGEAPRKRRRRRGGKGRSGQAAATPGQATPAEAEAVPAVPHSHMVHRPTAVHEEAAHSHAAPRSHAAHSHTPAHKAAHSGHEPQHAEPEQRHERVDRLFADGGEPPTEIATAIDWD